MTILRNLIAVLVLLSVIAPAAEARPRAHATAHRTAPREVAPYISTIDLADPVHAALAAHDRGRRVIVVFDIDNTLLTMPQDLGSDTWFNWQKAQENGDAQAFDGLIADSGLLFSLGEMRPTQPDAAALIHSLQAHHIAVFALSARGADLRGPTEAALGKAGIDLSSAPECGRPLCRRRGRLNDAQIRLALRQAHLAAPAKPFRPVTVSDGVMMVAGQDKGMMLHLLLSSLPGRYDDVIFVDDTFQNIRNVETAAPMMPARVRAYSYERFWPDAHDFMTNAARQTKTEADMKTLKAAICGVMAAAVCVR